MNTILVTRWTHPGMSALYLAGNAEKTRGDAFSCFGDDAKDITPEEMDMSKEEFEKLPEWNP